MAQGITGGAPAAAATYGLSPTKVTALGQEIEEYTKVIHAPQPTIADR